MLAQLIILCVIIFLGPIFPPILIPLSYSLTGALLIQHANPITLSILSVLSAVLSTTLIWIIQNHVIKKLNIYNQKQQKENIFNKINRYFNKYIKLNKVSSKREEYIKTRNGKIATFFFAIICYFPIIPDIITTRFLYKKIKFPYFLLALIIGKSFTHIPFIFLGKGLIQLISGRF